MATTVYRAFDCYDKDVRAPTPLPPIFLMKCVKEDEVQELLKETSTPASNQSTSATPASEQVKAGDRSLRGSNKSALVPAQESSSTSPLSDCPSDLSEWELRNKVRSILLIHMIIWLISVLVKEEQHKGQSDQR